MYCSCCAVTCCWWCILCCCCCWWWWCSCCSRRSPGCSCCNTLFCWLLFGICAADCGPFPEAESSTHIQSKLMSPKVKKKKKEQNILKKMCIKCSPFWPLLTVSEDSVIFTGVTELDKGKTLLFAALGLCLGAIDVSVGPTESVILMKKN